MISNYYNIYMYLYTEFKLKTKNMKFMSFDLQLKYIILNKTILPILNRNITKMLK